VTEPVSSTAAAKVAAGIGGLFGGLAILTFLKPHNLRDAAIRGGVSTGSAIVGAAPLTKYLGMDAHDWEFALTIGAAIGFCSWFVLSAVGNYFKKHEGEDIMEVVKSVKDSK
jgi:hypothetical protein